MRPVLQQQQRCLGKVRDGLRQLSPKILSSGLTLSLNFKALLGRRMFPGLTWRRNGSICLRQFKCTSLMRVGMVESCSITSNWWIILQAGVLWIYLTTSIGAWPRCHTKFKLSLIRCTAGFFIMASSTEISFEKIEIIQSYGDAQKAFSISHLKGRTVRKKG